MYSALQCESSLNDMQYLDWYPYIKHISDIGRLIFWKNLIVYSENHNSIFDLSDMRCNELRSGRVLLTAPASRAVTLRFKLHC